tara:strand:- start:3510 stop:6551 length:3042 start_codon:yes stop_codon:yes gene_type:complete
MAESEFLQRLRALVCPPEISEPELPPEPAPVEPDPVLVEDAELRFSPEATSIAQDALFIDSAIFNGEFAIGEERQIPLNVGLYQPWPEVFTAGLIPGGVSDDKAPGGQVSAIPWSQISTNPHLDTTSMEDIFRFRARKGWIYQDNKLMWMDDLSAIRRTRTGFDLAVPRVFSVGYVSQDPEAETENYVDIDNWPSTPFADLADTERMNIQPTQEGLQQYFNGDMGLFEKYCIGGFENNFRPTIPNNPNKIYYDTTFQISLPFSDRFVKDFPDLKNVLVFNSFSRYNYYIRRYENRISDLAIPERALPNLYVWLSFIERVKRDNLWAPIVSDLYNLISLNKIMDSNFLIKQTGTGPELKLGINLFDAFSLFYPEDDEPLESLKEKQKNMVMLSGEVDFLSTSNHVNNASLQKKHDFPMFLEINFKTPPINQSDLVSSFTQFDYDVPLIKEIIQGIPEAEDRGNRSERQRGIIDGRPVLQTDILTWRAYNKIVQGQESGINTSSLTSDLGTQNLKQMLRVWDLNNWLQLFKERGTNTYDFVSDDIITYLGFSKLSRGSSWFYSSTSLRTGSLIKQKLFSFLMNAKIKSSMKQYNRTWREIMAGKKAKSETMFYRIEKHALVSVAGEEKEEKIQDFYLINSNRIEVLQWLDTQVKYGEKYRYKVYAYQVVYGTQYQYARHLTNPYRFKVHYEPCLKMVEVPFHEFENIIMDSPPCQPVVEVLPHRGRSDKLTFFLRDNPGKLVQHPIAFNDIEKAMYDSVRQAQELPEDSPIMFRSDDRIESFFVYRMTSRPSAYIDFKDNMIAEVATTIEVDHHQRLCDLKASTIDFLDETIRPNIKYYYMFRSKDVHGHLSNPSPVFEVELIDTNGGVFPRIDIIEFPIEEVNYIKPARKYIYISPSVNQTQAREETLNAVLDIQAQIDDGTRYDNLTDQLSSIPVTMGDSDHSIWDGQKFKIRLTSKSTGRKIDFNVKFKHIHKPTVQQETCYEDPQVNLEELEARMRGRATSAESPVSDIIR